MEKIINDAFVLNGWVEISGGIVTLLLPRLMFPHSRTDIHVKYVSVWWSFAVIALGLVSLSLSQVSDYDLGKQISSIGFLVYHIGLILAHTPVLDPHKTRGSIMKYGALVAHSVLAYLFLRFAFTHAAFETAIKILKQDFALALQDVTNLIWK